MVGRQETFLTIEGLRKTVDTAKRRVGCLTADALRKTRQQNRRLQPGVLIQEFVLMLEPLP
jgi:hypothetical protein